MRVKCQNADNMGHWCSSQAGFICISSALEPCVEETSDSQVASVLLGPPGLEPVGIGLGCLVYPTSYSPVLFCLVQETSPGPPQTDLVSESETDI